MFQVLSNNFDFASNDADIKRHSKALQVCLQLDLIEMIKNVESLQAMVFDHSADEQNKQW